MSANDEGLTWDRKWTIVRTDLDLAHVFAPDDELSFTQNGNQYTVGHKSTEPGTNSLDGVVLTAVDGDQPAFDAISSDYPLPLFSAEHKQRYRTVAERIEVFAQQHRTTLRRLEGQISMSCHGFRYQDQESGADPHSERQIQTTIHVYQFANAVRNGDQRKRLLVIYKPFLPNCFNGNGTALGYD